MDVNEKDFEGLWQRIKYNSNNLGDYGEVIKLPYLKNLLQEFRDKLKEK